VTLDHYDERVSLTQEIRAVIAADALDSLPGAEVNDESRPMMLDTLTGLLTPVGGPGRPRDGRLTVPRHTDEVAPSTVDQESLVEAVARSLREEAGESPDGRARRVMRAYLSPAALSTKVRETRYRPLGVKVALDVDDRLVVRLTDEAVPGRHRDAAQGG
jgi:hypothetical protein